MLSERDWLFTLNRYKTPVLDRFQWVGTQIYITENKSPKFQVFSPYLCLVNTTNLTLINNEYIYIHTKIETLIKKSLTKYIHQQLLTQIYSTIWQVKFTQPTTLTLDTVMTFFCMTLMHEFSEEQNFMPAYKVYPFSHWIY